MSVPDSDQSQHHKTEPRVVDVQVVHHGTVVLFHLNTPKASQWADEHIPDDAMWIGDAFAVEPRYAQAIIDGMRQDGLKVRL